MKITCATVVMTIALVVVAIAGVVHCDGNGVTGPVEFATVDSLHFGDVRVGELGVGTFHIVNAATPPADSLRGSVWRGPDCDGDYHIMNAEIEYVLAPGDSFMVEIGFMPTRAELGIRCDIRFGTPPAP